MCLRHSFIVIAAFCAQYSRAAVIDYWRFEEGSGTFAGDQTGLANGTLQGFPDTSAGAGDSGDLGWSVNTPSASIPQTGQANLSSLHFAPYGGQVSASPAGDIALGANFTIEFYFNFDTIPGINEGSSFLRFYDSETFLELGAALTLQGNTRLVFFGNDDTATGSVFLPIETPNILTHTWYHLAFVKDGDNAEFYIDGSPIGGGSLGPNASDAFTFATTGTYLLGSGTRNMYGRLDEIRISDTALDPSQFLDTIPEPSTFTLVGVTSLLFAFIRRKTQP